MAAASFAGTLQSIQAGRIAPLYLLYGDEEYLREELLAEIEARLIDPAASEFNSDKLDAEECSPEDIRNAAETLPFLGSRRLVAVRRAERLEENIEELESLLENPPESACLVLMASPIEEGDARERRRRAPAKLIKKVRQSGVVVATDPLKNKDFGVRVQKMASRLGFKLDGEALGLLVERTGGSLRRASSELEKLALHVEEDEGGREEGAPLPGVSLEKVAAVVDDGRTENLFALTDALGARNAGKALESLRRLFRQDHHGAAIVVFLSRHFVRLLGVRVLLDDGVPVAAVPKRLGGHPFYARKLAEQARRFSDAELRKALVRLQQTDILLRGSGLPDWAVMESLTLDLCLRHAKAEQGGLTKRGPVAAAGRGRAG
ncbi:MAG: DNA polymerase III subunit delta [bacterium]